MIVGFVNGCFDVLHYGHIRLLRAAREQCDILIVAINSDFSYRELKKKEPVNNEEIRKETLESIRYIEQVTIFDDTDVCEALLNVMPNKWFKGSDYSLETINKKELALANKIGCQIVFIPTIDKEKYSSSNFKLC